jgi:hypothetical protein
MVADEAELEIVQELFRRKANGASMPELAAWTREIGVRPNPYHFLTPGPGLSQNHIFRILKKDFYATGIFRFTVSAPRWPSEMVEQAIQLPKLVPQDLFDELSRQRTMRIGKRQAKGRCGAAKCHPSSGRTRVGMVQST